MARYPRYVKRPVRIEAVQLTPENLAEVADWASSDVVDDHVVIHTLEGDHRANVGDWVAQGVKGEFYPIRDDIFALTYALSET